jgi:hypothetical protein
VDDRIRKSAAAVLPFALTPGQRTAIKEIVEDIQRPSPMHRLLQGDVGSGKTIVALLAAVVAMENGLQVAMLAPTEILAKQHYATLARQLASTRFRVDLLTGRHHRHRPAHHPRAPRAGLDAPRGGHARAGAGNREIPPARPRGDRRAAPLRRGAARGHAREGPAAGRAVDDGHARFRARSRSPTTASSTCRRSSACRRGGSRSARG